MKLRSGEFAKYAAMSFDNLGSSWESPGSYREVIRELADDTMLGRLAKKFPALGSLAMGAGGMVMGDVVGPFVEPVADLAGTAIGGLPGKAVRAVGSRKAMPTVMGATGAGVGNMAGHVAEGATRALATKPWAAAHVGVDKIVDLLKSLRGR